MFALKSSSSGALWGRGFENLLFSALPTILVGAGTSFLISKVVHAVFGSDGEGDRVRKEASFIAGMGVGFYVGMRFFPFASFTFKQTKELFLAERSLLAITLIACAVLRLLPLHLVLFGVGGALLGMTGRFASLGFAVTGSAAGAFFS